MARAWVKMKRGLFYMPNDRGYTGIRDHAGRFTEAEAVAETSCEGVTCMPLDEAPEFSSACFDDYARAHLAVQRDTLRAALREAVEELGTCNRMLSGEDYNNPRFNALLADTE